jgi:hypothetical protein
MKRRFERKVLQEKENGFVLDCLNEQKAKLKHYNSISDKYLNYFVIRVHPNVTKSKSGKHTHSVSKIDKVEFKEQISHSRFQEMLMKEKEKLSMGGRASHSQQGSIRKSSGDIREGGESECVVMTAEAKQAIKYRPQHGTIKERTEEQEELEAEPKN